MCVDSDPTRSMVLEGGPRFKGYWSIFEPTTMEYLERIIDLCQARGVALSVVINLPGHETPTVEIRRPRRSKSKTGFSDAGLLAVMAIKNGSIDARDMSINDIAKACDVPRSTLYADQAFRKFLAQYQATGRMPRRGAWDSRIDGFDVEDVSDDEE